MMNFVGLDLAFADQVKLLAEPAEIGNFNEEVFHLVRQINSEVDSDDVQELLNLNNQEVTMDELIRMSKILKNLSL
ncbi:hypothetical protein TNCV_4397701 [Trichonephila clavipes]|nr:hypothetical protein TNCV_4397701 [Trichonephila clavipes]